MARLTAGQRRRVPSSGGTRAVTKRQFAWKRNDEMRAYLADYKLESGCIDCPDDTPWPPEVLDFDHVRGVKLGNLAALAGKAMSFEAILTEIEKCEVVCANHHRIRTHS